MPRSPERRSRRSGSVRCKPRPQAPPAPTTAPAVTPAKAAAVSWNLVGVFPNPVTCTIAGATTGRPFYCGFYFFFWGLNVLY